MFEKKAEQQGNGKFHVLLPFLKVLGKYVLFCLAAVLRQTPLTACSNVVFNNYLLQRQQSVDESLRGDIQVSALEFSLALSLAFFYIRTKKKQAVPSAVPLMTLNN